MRGRVTWFILAAAPFVAAAGCAVSHPSALAELPVSAMYLVPPDDYREASTLAARGGAVLDVALKVVGTFEGSAQQIFQVNDVGEAPSRSRVSVLRDGLLDDSLRGDRWEISLERTAAGPWRIAEVRRAWRCRRGGQTEGFTTLRCP